MASQGHWTAPPGLFKNSGDVCAVFETIYERRVWDGGSGSGSHPQMVQPYLRFLQGFLTTNAISSVVDIGCGDWQFSRLINWGTGTYHGIDVVSPVIEANQKEFGRERVRFTCTNPLDEGFDVGGGDLLLMKDVLQHLNNANAMKLLGFTRKFKFSLITNDYGVPNVDCNNGDTRPLDIRAEPFNIRHAAGLFGFNGKAVFLVTTPDWDR